MTEMTQQVGRKASNPMSLSFNPEPTSGVMQTPGADIANFAYSARKTHRERSLTIQHVALPLDVLHERKEPLVATIIGSVTIASIISNRTFILEPK